MRFSGLSAYHYLAHYKRSKSTNYFQWSRVRGIQHRKGITPLDSLRVLSSRPPNYWDFPQKE
nr:MAG TPA: hypothetical protein [Bacteriophage sp.]